MVGVDEATLVGVDGEVVIIVDSPLLSSAGTRFPFISKTENSGLEGGYRR